MVVRLGVCALAVTCVIAIVFLVALRSRTADFNGDWLLEDLTCEELVEAYGFELVVLDQLVDTYTGCLEYSNSPADAGFGRLHCELLRKEGEFVKGVANDIANVYNAKLECTNP